MNHPSLKKNNHIGFKYLFQKKSLQKIKKDYTDFKKAFSNSKWVVTSTVSEGNKNLEISIKGNSQIGNHAYELEAKQLVSISIDNGRIMEYEIISQESTLKSSDNK